MDLITIESVQKRAEADARTYGYYLNPDPDFLRNLFEGLKENEERYGYPSCPCRLASGKLELDRDILCPCDYRDPDVLEYGFCYCALYVRKDVFEGTTPVVPIPERRPLEKQTRAYETVMAPPAETTESQVAAPKEPALVKLKFWYCRQCGYVSFREDPPYICPVCKAKREMFSEVKLSVNPT